MASKPIIRRDELVVHLKHRLGQVSIDKRTVLEKVHGMPEAMVSLRLDALIGEMTMRVAVEAMYEELKERIGAEPENGVQFVD